MSVPKKTADTKTACSVTVEDTRWRKGKKLKRFWYVELCRTVNFKIELTNIAPIIIHRIDCSNWECVFYVTQLVDREIRSGQIQFYNAILCHTLTHCCWFERLSIVQKMSKCWCAMQNNIDSYQGQFILNILVVDIPAELLLKTIHLYE